MVIVVGDAAEAVDLVGVGDGMAAFLHGKLGGMLFGGFAGATWDPFALNIVPRAPDEELEVVDDVLKVGGGTALIG